MHKTCITILILLLYGLLSAQPIDLTGSKLQYGSLITIYDARSLALGGTGIAGAHALHAAGRNPALLTTMEEQIAVFGAGMITRYEEDRAYPYYDNFGGFVDFGSYVYNSAWYGNFAWAANINLADLTGINLTAGLSSNPVLGFDYEYLEEVRTTGFTDEILAYNKIVSEGGFREYSVAAGIGLFSGFSVGAKAGFITGTVDQKAEIFPVSDNLADIAQLETSAISLAKMPLRTEIGLHFQVDPQFGIGAFAGLPFTVETENHYQLQTNDPDLPRILDPGLRMAPDFSAGTAGYDSTGESRESRTVKYPLRLGAGLEYRFTNILEARISADFEYVFWSDMTDNWSPGLSLSDIYIIKLGIEHIFFDQMPFRVGFNYQPLKESKNYTRSIFTLGIGLLFDGYQIDLGGGFENLTSNQEDLFPNGLYPPLSNRTEPTDRVKTSNFYGIVEFRFFLNDIIK
jgi:hypothetical protein